MMAVIPQVFQFDAELGDEEIIDDTLPDRLILCVGNFVGDLEIRVSSKDRPQREAIQTLLHESMFSQEGRRGTIVLTSPPLTIGGVATSVAAQIAYTLGSSGWRDEFAFDKRRWQFLDVEAELQMLVMLADPVYNMDTLVLSLETDLEFVVEDLNG